MTELKPCPFCGSKKIRESVDGTLDFNNCLWYCEDCGADGPNNNSIDESLNAWNRRASPWVNIKERLPDAHELVFIYVKSTDKMYEAVFHEDRNSFDIDYQTYNPTGISYGLSIDDVTHWMPIPEIEG